MGIAGQGWHRSSRVWGPFPPVSWIWCQGPFTPFSCVLPADPGCSLALRGLSPLLFPFEVISGADSSVLRVLLWVLQATQLWPIFLPVSKKFLCCPPGVQISLVPFKTLPSTQHREMSPHSCSLVLFILQGITHSLSYCHQSIPRGSFCSTSGHN